MTRRTLTSKRYAALGAAATIALGVAAAAPAAGAAETPFASVAHDTLTIRGTDHADDITIGVGADPNTLVVDFHNGTTTSVDRSTFTAISVLLRSGNDSFAVAAGSTFDEALTVYGGAGNDAITGGPGNDVIYGGAGNDMLLGGDGNDLIFGGSGNDTVDGQRGADTEVLGVGNDTAVWLPGEGSDVIDGGLGHDALVFKGANAAEKFALTAQGSHAVLTRDVATIRMDTDGVEQLDLTTLGGTDSVSVGDLTGTDLREANVDLSAAGDAGAGDAQLDIVVVDGTTGADQVRVAADGSAVDVTGLHSSTHVTGSDTRDQLQVATGDGNDSVAVSDAARALIGVSVDLGAGQL
jgi:hypothetical protein